MNVLLKRDFKCDWTLKKQTKYAAINETITHIDFT